MEVVRITVIILFISYIIYLLVLIAQDIEFKSYVDDLAEGKFNNMADDKIKEFRNKIKYLKLISIIVFMSEVIYAVLA